MKANRFLPASALLAIILLAASSAFARKLDKNNLVVRGKVTKISLLPHAPHYVGFEVALNLEFVNTGTTPIIFLRPNEKSKWAQIFWLGSASLWLTESQAKHSWERSAIWSLGGLPANDITSPIFREMVGQLDQSIPPPELTQVLQPKETWTWQTECILRFNEKTEDYGSSSDLGWEVIGKIGTPLWMRLTYVVWPNNLLRAEKNLKRKLQARWKNIGVLNINEDVMTEPIEVKLDEVAANSR